MCGIDQPPAPMTRWDELADLALRGLRQTYAVGLPHTMRWDGRRAIPAGFNVRYALISLLGLGRAKSLGMDCGDVVDALWARVESSREAVDRSAGDLGLALWAQAMTGRRGLFMTSDALRVFRNTRGEIDTVQLAWLMLGADHVLFEGADTRAQEIVSLAKADLLALYNSDTRLFYRHARRGLISNISRRISCFANQIYPVMALAVHAQRTGGEDIGVVGRAVADNLCEMQGTLGQWWWLYDARDGGVVDGYPVFSVHQDGMAPMALMESTRAGGRSYLAEIARSVSWIFGENELASPMVCDGPGLVLRDIHRQGVGRVARAVRSAAWTWGYGKKTGGVQAARLQINPECRPYHLGWILYASALVESEASITAGKLVSVRA